VKILPAHSGGLTQPEYERSISLAIAGFLEEHGGSVLLFAHVFGSPWVADDRQVIRRIAQSLGGLTGRVVMMDDSNDPHLLSAAYSRLDVLLGTRMHSNIFALSQGVPCLAVGYLHKTRGMMRMLDLEQWCLDVSGARGDCVARRLAELWRSRKAVRLHLARIIPSLAEQSEKVAQMIASDYLRMH
jgi:colanic acid/amylovoran biosynthesis protein